MTPPKPLLCCKECDAIRRERDATVRELEKHHGYYKCVSKIDADAAVRRADDFWRADNDRLLVTLKASIGLIRAWHGEPGWALYFQYAPEMEPIRAASARAGYDPEESR